VENLLSITRIQDGRLQMNKQEEMLEEVAGEAVLTTLRRFPQAEIELELTDELLYFPMDSVLIKQVLVNLLENAIRHSGNQRGIRVVLGCQEDRAVVEIRDRGRGLPQEVLKAVLEGKAVPRDQSGDSTRGMGIGLAVCGSIIKAHNGTLAAENIPEGGAVFRIELPMTIQGADNQEGAEA